MAQVKRTRLERRRDGRPDCVFCRIVAGEAPVSKVFELDILEMRHTCSSAKVRTDFTRAQFEPVGSVGLGWQVQRAEPQSFDLLR